MMMTLEEVKKLAEDKTYGRILLTTVCRTGRSNRSHGFLQAECSRIMYRKHCLFYTIASFTPFGIDCSSGVETDGWKIRLRSGRS